jgi:hypothetical protein
MPDIDVFEQNHPTAPLYCHLKCNPQPFMIDGDRDQLSEVIVELQKSDEHVLIDIQDNGPGKAKGTGLSLSICRQIIERHGAPFNYWTRMIAAPRFASCCLGRWRLNGRARDADQSCLRYCLGSRVSGTKRTASSSVS